MPRNSDLARLETDREGLKRDIFERLKLRGERATPVMVDKEIAALERSHAALDGNPGGPERRRHGALLQP